jgi:ribonuclease T1
MRQLKPLLICVALIVAAILWSSRGSISGVTTSAPAATANGRTADVLPGFLPPEARVTLDRIASDGPFPHRQDGVIFGNYENLLPQQPRGYYHEYTVETPGADTRGTRRIITGGTPPNAYYYTDDHYRSFRAFQVGR